MRAVVLTGLGAARDVLQYRTDYPKPVRKPGEVLVEVHATSVNPAEVRLRDGSMPKGMLTVPQILGCDLAGVVLEADPGGKYKPGDRVVGCTGQILKDPWGTYAELCSCRADRLTHIPEGVTFEQAASLPIAGMTAWQALAPSMPLAGKRVLVHAGAGGVGHFAVQIAKAQGAFVAATCSGRNMEFVTRELKADLAIDYTREELVKAAGEPYDVVLDLVGAEPESWAVLKRGGRMAAVSWDKLVGGKKGMPMMLSIMCRVMRLKTSSALGLRPRYDMVEQEYDPSKGLQQLAQLVAEGKVVPHIEAVMGLEQMTEAHEHVERHKTRGKVVIKVKP